MIRVLIGAERRLYRAGLAALLGGENQIEVIAESAYSHDPVSAAIRVRPDVLLLDIDQTNGHSSINAVTELRERLPSCRVVMLTVSGWPGLLRRAMDAQVMGLLDKDAPPAHLAEMIRKVAAGERVVDPNLAVTALYLSASPFTEREMDVLRIAAEGASAAEIAQKLSLTQGTVRNYLSRIMNKTSARTRIDAVRIAQNSGWF
jgi:two-component system response regulator DesR